MEERKIIKEIHETEMWIIIFLIFMAVSSLMHRDDLNKKIIEELKKESFSIQKSFDQKLSKHSIPIYNWESEKEFLPD